MMRSTLRGMRLPFHSFGRRNASSISSSVRWNGPKGARERVEDEVSDLFAELRDVRRDLHQHPELGLQEHRTSSLVARRLEELGLEVETGIGKTGVVGTLEGLGERQEDWRVQSIGLRADMDCLPMQEENAFDHKSETNGLMHACGHDGHTTMLLGAAQYLANNRDLFSGKVHFFFQPAEENAGGARLMIEDGVLRTKYRCDEVYGVHNWPYFGQGKISIREGPIMASNDEFDVRIKGRGGHAAMPHLSVDPVAVACQIVSSLQSVVSRGVDPLKSGVLSVTQIHGGSAYNVIPEHVTLKGTIRTFREEDRASIAKKLETISVSVCEAFGATCTVRLRPGYPATVNAPEQTEYARQAAVLTVGEENVVAEDPTMGAEDFSYMLQESPGCYAWIGCDSQGKLHEPNFDFDDNIIPVGVQYFVNLVKLRLPTSSTVLEEQALEA